MKRFTAKIQRTIHAPVDRVWEGLTRPEWVKQYFFGTELVTDWKPGHPVLFRGEWEGKAYEDKGTVLRFEPGKMLEYDYHSSWSKQEDLPENRQIISYRLTSKGNATVVIVTQSNIETIEQKQHSAKNWSGILLELKKLLEAI